MKPMFVGLFGLLLIFSCPLASESLGQPGQLRQPDEMFLMAPRSMMRSLREGEAAIADGRYTDAVNALGALLQDSNSDLPEDLRGQDFFIEAGTQGLYQSSVKGEAIRLLSELPEDGRRTMEIQLGVKARKLLDEAIAQKDFTRIGNVAREYVHTQAGYDAQILLAQYNLTTGFPLAAAGILQNLLDYPAARERFGVRLVYAAAMAWLQAGNRELAIETLRLSVRDFPGASLTIDGQQIAVEAATNWGVILERQMATLSRSQQQTPDAWLTAGGSPDRSAEVSVGLPLPNLRWKKEIHSSVPERESLLEVEELARKAARVILPKFELRMIDDTIITKTTDGGVLGIDFETGNIIWEHYFGSSAAPLKGLSLGGRFDESPVSRELQDRVWGSSAFGRVSCDSERFYYISREGEQPINPNAFLNVRSKARDANYLEGVSIARQGAILWRVGGDDGGDEPKLAGVYFLGPPLAYQGQLYSILEVNGETNLAVLDPATGKLQWIQQLAHSTMMRPIGFDEERQAQAISPTIADGVILCPTGVGAVVAVDLLSRSLRWGAIYRSPENANQQRFGGGAFGMSLPEYRPLDSRWEDTAMIAERGIVAFSPPDSEAVYCRDILTGAQIVSPQPRRDARYVAGLYNDQVVLVGEKGIYAFSLRPTKRITWQVEYPAGKTLAGKGLWQRDSMLVPLTGSTVIQVSLEDGKIIEQATVDQELGNLFAYRDQLLSVNSTAVSVFYTKESLTSEVEKRLAVNSKDPWALNQKSQVLSADGKLDEAMELLRASFELDPSSADTRFLLVDTLLAGLETDFDKYAGLADSLDGVVELGPQRLRFLQQLALGKIRAGDHVAAFGRLYELMNYQIEMSDKSQGRPSKIRLSERLVVDSDAWITAALARSYLAASEADQTKMQAMVAQTLDSVQGTMAPLRRQRLRYLAWLPSAATSLIGLADDLLGDVEQTTAEQLLQPLLVSDEAEVKQRAEEMLRTPANDDWNLLWPAGRDYANALTGRRNGSPTQGRPAIEKSQWKKGRVDVSASQEYGSSIGRQLPFTGERYGRPEISVALSDSLLVISNANGETVSRLSYKPATSDLSNQLTRVYVRGGLLIVETGSEVAALDLYSGFKDSREALLWRHSLVGASPTSQFRGVEARDVFLGNGMNAAPNASLGITIQRRQTPDDQQAVVGPLTPACIVIQSGTEVSGLDPLSGRLLWTRDGYGSDLRFAASGIEVAIVNPAEGKTEIVDCRDGSRIREQEYRGNWTHWVSHGPVMLDLLKSETGNKVNLRLWNALTGEVIEDMSVSSGARAEVCENRYVAITEPVENKLHFVDLGKPLYRVFDTPVDPRLVGISVERFMDRLVILCNIRNSREVTPMEHSVNGNVYAVDLNTNQLCWKQPGKVFGMGFPHRQPRNSPFVAVHRFSEISLPDAPNSSQATVAVVDLRDGHLAFEDTFKVKSTGFNMRLKPTEQIIEVTVGERTYELQVTDEARPPQPVFVFGNEAR